MDILSSLTAEQINFLILHYLGIILNWWWFYLPPVLFLIFRFLYLYWLQDRWWEKNYNPIVLEIKIPEEVAKTPRAMEQVFAGWWQLYDPPNWKEKWCEGQSLLSFSCEIVGIDGKPHFFLRIPKRSRQLFESHIYAQYPDIEITEVEDYTKAVPSDIPNKDWDMWGCDYVFTKPTYYPIKTYPHFEEESIKEEKRIDPLSNFLEGIAKLKKGEQIWLQIRVCPVLEEEEFPWRKPGEKAIREIVEKTPPKKSEPFLSAIFKGVAEAFIHSKPPGEEEKKEEKLDLGALKLAPHEIEILKAIGNKIAKHGFLCNVRHIYLGKREAFFRPNLRIPMSYITGELAAANLNTLKYWGKTGTKVVYWFIKRRLYLRKRRMVRQYRMRVSPLYPRPSGPGNYILNSEELATIFHFPGRQVAPVPTIKRVEAKKGGPPSELPVE